MSYLRKRESLMIILGLNSVFHESSATLIVDGHVVVAAEEERFTRRKHTKHADVEWVTGMGIGTTFEVA
jgi:predicted NodU family carbamoyl transferase